MKRNKESIHRFVELVVNQGRIEYIDELIAADFVGHARARGPVIGREGMRAFVTLCRRAFSDLYVRIDDAIAEDDRVAVSWTATSASRTDDGEGWGLRCVGITFVRLLAGKQVESHTEWELERRVARAVRR